MMMKLFPLIPDKNNWNKAG